MAAGFAYCAKFAISHEECGRGAHLPLLGREPILSTADDHWRRQGEEGEASPLWMDVQKLCNMCVLSLSWNFIVSHDKYIARPSSRATLIHRQYIRDRGTSYSRPPIDPYLTSPCYKILAAPLQTTCPWLAPTICFAVIG